MARRKLSLNTLTVRFRDERIKPLKKRLPLDEDGGFEGGVTFKLPNGEKIEVFASGGEGDDEMPESDVLIGIQGENERTSCTVRCCSGVIVSYVTPSGFEILAQMGTGPWED